MRIEDPLWVFPRCRCGHHMDAHHPTRSGRYTWCSCWSPDRCPCTRYTPQEEDDE